MEVLCRYLPSAPRLQSLELRVEEGEVWDDNMILHLQTALEDHKALVRITTPSRRYSACLEPRRFSLRNFENMLIDADKLQGGLELVVEIADGGYSNFCCKYFVNDLDRTFCRFARIVEGRRYPALGVQPKRNVHGLERIRRTDLCETRQH